MSLLKRFSKDIAGYGLGIGITKSLGLISLPLLTTFFSVENIGLIELALAVSSIALLLVLLGVDTGLTYFYWNEADTNARNSYVATSFVTVIVSMIGVILLLGAGQGILDSFYFNQDSDHFYYTLLLAIGFQALFMLSTKVLRIQRVVFKYNLVVIVNALVFIGFLYFLLKHSPTVNNYFISKSVSFVIAVALCIYIIRKNLIGRISFSKSKELLTYSIPLVPFAVVATLMAVLDKVFINYLIDIEAVGFFAIGAKIGSSVALLITAFAMAFGPFAMSIKNHKDCNTVYVKVFLGYLSFMLLSVLGLMSIDNFVVEWITPENGSFAASTIVIGPIALSLVVHSLFSQLGIGLNLTKNNKYFFYGAVVALVANSILNPLFIPVFGILGAAYASIISYLIITLWIYFIAQKKYPINYPKRVIGWVIVCFVMAYGLMVNSEMTGSFGARILICTGFLVAILPPVVKVLLEKDKVEVS